ncbi:MAG TPA: hypothetical protein ENN13_04125 [Candidatus Altiarchaeales archaeon]|nr:hypothetical protein [Candidatus Altiarchaeales archaeon]
MRLAFLTLIVILLATASVAQEEFLKESWRAHTSTGVHYIKVMDIEGHGLQKVYTASFGDQSSSIFIYNHQGIQLDSIKIPTPLDTKYPTGKERVRAVELCDLDDDGDLDIISSTQIQGAQINTHILYRLEQKVEYGKEGVYVRMEWFHDTFGYVNHISLTETPQGPVITASSLKGNVIFLDESGALKKSIDTKSASAWHTSVIDSDDPQNDFVSAISGGVCRYKSGGIAWCGGRDARYVKALAQDLDGAGDVEVFALSDGTAELFTGDGELVWAKELSGVTDACMADLKRAGAKNIIIAQSTNLLAYNFMGELKWSYDVGERINAVESADVDGDGNTEIIVGTSRNLMVLSLNQNYAIREAADLNLESAKKLSEQRRYADALNKSGAAETLYRQLGDSEKQEEAQQVTVKSRELLQAIRTLAEAVLECDSGQYEGCTSKAGLSLEVFEKYGIEDFARNASKIIETAGKRVEADSLYRIATDQYVNGEYAQSLENIEQAITLYTEIELSLGQRRSQSLKTLILERFEELGITTTTTTIRVTTTTIPFTQNIREQAEFYGILLLALAMIGFGAYTRLRKR